MTNTLRVLTSTIMLTGFVTAHAQSLHSVPGWPMPPGPIAIQSPAESQQPFSVAAEHGAIFGQQRGTFEAWAFPVKILSNFRIEAELADYPVPIDLNEYASHIEVNPEQTTITYSHAAFTVKQHMFSPRGDSVAGTGALVLFEIESIRPLQLTFRFTPEMLRMWPAANFGRPNAEWMKQGYYLLHTDTDELTGAVGIPGAEPGIMAPYQERPKTYAVELKLHFDPKQDAGRLFPLLMAVGTSAQCAERIGALNERVAALYRATAGYYAHFFDTRLTVESPDPKFDAAIKWAEIAIDQAQVKHGDETGLVAGYYSSGDSARPGFGWFFGRDTEWTLYAVNSYGDFALTRTALDFLFRRQREDGKIMHEYSQMAEQLDWKATPYFYASADSTPLLVMILEDYVNASGDAAYLAQHWDAVKKAYAFTREHEDADGTYGNSQGTGWVESWPGGMPKQEVYMASLDQQSSNAMAHLAALMKDDTLAGKAHQKAEQLRVSIPAEYLSAATKFFAFSRNPDGSQDLTPTIYPAVAWWTGTLMLPNADTMLERWASHEFSTDWGTRDVSAQSPIYDPISYHQGSVWPLFTGWVSMAEFRAGQPIAARQHLYQDLLLTWAQDLGACTELLSGAFYQPLGRSSSHQLWSSAMVLTPAIRGLLGINWDANGSLTVKPNLPADWDSVRVHNVPVGNGRVHVDMKRVNGSLIISYAGKHLTVALPPVEIDLEHVEPLPGGEPAQMKALFQDTHSLTLEALGGTSYDLPLRVNQPGIQIAGGTVNANRLHVSFDGSGWVRKKITW